MRRAAGSLRRRRCATTLRRCVRAGIGGCRSRGERLSFRRDSHPRPQDHAGRVRHRDAFMSIDVDLVDFKKGDGLVPAIVQDADTGAVLMMAYMNREALELTIARGRAVFFSRSKQRLWEKGETTGHTLDVVGLALDCDQDTLLITARPRGPACHNGTLTCFGDEPRSAATH